MRIACAVEVTHARNEEPSTWQREEVEVSINRKAHEDACLFNARRGYAKSSTPVAVPARASPPLPPSPPVDESEMEARARRTPWRQVSPPNVTELITELALFLPRTR